MPVALERHIQAFLAHLRLARRLAKNTELAYGRDLGRFAAFCETRALRNMGAVSADAVREFVQTESEAGLGARSLRRRISTLRTFFRYLEEEGHAKSELLEGLATPRIGRRLPRTASEEELLSLLRTPDPETLRGLRDRALLSLTYAAGLRASEVVALQIGDIDFDKGTVTPLGKGNKRRVVPVSELTLEQIREYLTRRKDLPRLCASPVLFAGPSGKAMTRQAFWKLLDRYARQGGIDRHLHPHLLRHSFASHLVHGGADLRSVQKLLGHQSITTTEIYTHVTSDHVERAYRASHPRAESEARARRALGAEEARTAKKEKLPDRT